MIKINVDLESIAGYSACARDILQAIDGKVDYFINPIKFGDTNVQLNDFWTDKLKDNSLYQLRDYDITISVGLPDRHYLIEENKYNIGYSHWEVSKIGAKWVVKMNEMDEIWTGSEFAREVFISSGVKVPIIVIHWPDIMEPSNSPELFTPLQENCFTFLHMGTFDERKNFKDVILAYCAEFQDECMDIDYYVPNKLKPTILVLKTYQSLDNDYIKIQVNEKIKSLVNSMNLKRTPYIHVVQERVDDKKLNNQVASIDALAYTTHSEGVGGPAIIAQRNNKPVICAKWSAMTDYVDTNYWVDYCLEPVHGMSHIVPYLCNPMWARLDITDLRNKMRQCYLDSLNNKNKKVSKLFSPEHVCNEMEERLNEINPKCN